MTSVSTVERAATLPVTAVLEAALEEEEAEEDPAAVEEAEEEVGMVVADQVRIVHRYFGSVLFE